MKLLNPTAIAIAKPAFDALKVEPYVRYAARTAESAAPRMSTRIVTQLRGSARRDQVETEK